MHMKRIKIGNTQKMGAGNEWESYILQTEKNSLLLAFCFRFSNQLGRAGDDNETF